MNFLSENAVAKLSNNRNLKIAPNFSACPVRLLSAATENFSSRLNFSPKLEENSIFFQKNFHFFPSTSFFDENSPKIRNVLPPGRNLLEFFEPNSEKLKIFDPRPKIKIYAIRMIQIRHRKMKKHQRRKRWKRDRHLKMKRQFLKKQRAEREFRQRNFSIMLDAINFDAKQYVQETLKR